MAFDFKAKKGNIIGGVGNKFVITKGNYPGIISQQEEIETYLMREYGDKFTAFITNIIELNGSDAQDAFKDSTLMTVGNNG